MVFRLLVIVLANYQICQSIPIDNGVIGDAEIECGSSAVGISFNTKNPFEGHVYVKGLYNEEGCNNPGQGGNTGFILLPFQTCNVERIRSLNPRGVFVTTTVVISFHPKFLTKIDRAYKIQCFYMEADKTVSAELEVSPLTTAFQTENVPMPVCRYDILDGGPTGQPIKYVLVGQQIYHKWICDSDTVNTFCMVVNTCFVNDGSGDKVDLINGEGCAVDKYLLRNLEYPTDLMAGQEAHAFKYADRVNLYFQCQIAITVKEPGQECPRPTCPALRRTRSQDLEPLSSRHPEFLDVAYSIDVQTLDDSIQNPNPEQPIFMETKDDICMSNAGFAALLIVLVLILTVSLTVTLITCWKRIDILRKQDDRIKLHTDFLNTVNYYGY